MSKNVVFITPILPHYRAKFHENMKIILDTNQVNYDIFYSQPHGAEVAKRDTIDISWATLVNTTHFGRDGRLIWQHALLRAMKADLIVIGQENRLLINYVLQMLPARLRPRLALWGHGRNFQSRNPDGVSERFKRFWATKADWWFAYTEETRRHIESLGYPHERITVFNNAVDTTELRQQVAAVDEHRLAALRRQFGIGNGPIGVFIGGIYPDKRMAFLVEAADHIRARVPDFEFVVIGGGSDLPLTRELAQTRPWMHVMGPRFGQEKVDLMCMGHVFLMPGLMGLAILDAGVTGLPIATTAFPWHSPEVAYLEPGVNGLLVDDWQNARAYGDAVGDLLLDPVRRGRMADAARAMADRYSIEQMAQRFAAGILQALGA